MEPHQCEKYTIVGEALVNRATGEVIPPTEPVFILRAKDARAVPTIQYYESIARDAETREGVSKTLKKFQYFGELFPELMKHGLLTANPKNSPDFSQTELPHWPYCTECKAPYTFDSEGPFAYCQCGTAEWYSRPAAYVLDPNSVK